MDHVEGNALPKEKSISDPVCIQNVSEYLGRIRTCISKRQQKGCVVVYRGEPDVYEQPCRPNIFRKGVLKGNDFFEKNLFDTMRQSKLTGEKRYLDNAIDAQHGEFPSRLLDVSYNCLIALYFAVTPYYHYREDSMDKKDGMVYLFFMDEIFSPSAQNTNDNYNAIINRNQDWYQSNSIFWNNHKFIDHTKLNGRIIAQQGAFILFPGEEPQELPKYVYCGIRIPGESKALIRQELNQLFGIHTGSVYPEIINLVKELSGKSTKLNTEEFCCENEAHHTLKQLEQELLYYLDYALEQRKSDRIGQILVHIEQRLSYYRQGIKEFQEYCKYSPSISEEWAEQMAEQYNQLVQRFSDAIEEYHIGELSWRTLKL